jgi:hypothetical protein
MQPFGNAIAMGMTVAPSLNGGGMQQQPAVQQQQEQQRPPDLYSGRSVNPFPLKGEKL